jgi:two-component system sensor histidine kinase HupT/HoxJ
MHGLHGALGMPTRHPHNIPLSVDLPGVDESTWLDVIQKMDEVYTKLVADEVALEEKNAELEQSQQFIFGLLTAMSDVLLACNQDGLIEETNRALCELVGREETNLRGQPLVSLLADASSLQHWQRALAQVNALHEGTEMEINLLHASGAAITVDLNCTPRHNARGRHVGYVMVGRPLGELRRAYHQLREAHEALKRTQQQLLHSEKMASLGRLVAGVAHELNNPISFVLGNVYSLQRYTLRMAQYLDAIHQTDLPSSLQALRTELRIDRVVEDLPSLMDGTLEGAQRTADIVHGLKRFSAKDKESFAVVELNAVVERAMHWVKKGMAPQFSIHWTPAADCYVTGHAGQLLQVMMNLMENAYDAAVAINATNPQLDIALERGATHATLRFEDNGPGIAPENLMRIFDPFFTTKSVGKGTGLGLSISYTIMEQHGGHLKAENGLEGGAVFSMAIPITEGH